MPDDPIIDTIADMVARQDYAVGRITTARNLAQGVLDALRSAGYEIVAAKDIANNPRQCVDCAGHPLAGHPRCTECHTAHLEAGS